MMSQRKPYFLIVVSLVITAAFLPCHAFNHDDALAKILAEPEEKRLESALAIQQGSLPQAQQLSVIEFIAEQYFARNEYQKAIRHFLKAEQLAADLKLISKQAKYAKMQGVATYYRGYYISAVESYERALHLFEQAEEPLQQAHLYNNIGLAYSRAERFEKAIENYEMAKALYALHGTDQDRADINHNIAAIYIESDRYEAALELYNNVSETFERLGDVTGLAQMHSNLGVIYRNLGRTEEAAQAYNHALKLLSQTNDTMSLNHTTMNLANLYFMSGKYEQALELLEQASTHSEQIEYQRGRVTAHEIKAKVLFAQGDYQAAENALQRAYMLAKEADSEQAKAELLPQQTYLIELLLAAAQGENERAVELYSKYERERDEELNKAVSSRLNDFYAKYNNNQLQQQVDSLKQQQKIDRLAAQQRNVFTWLVTGLLLLSGIIGVLMYRRAAERRASAELEQKVQQRTQELEELAHQLRSANEIKSQFLANISHEIRTPLTSIMGQAEAIIQGDVPEKEVPKELRVIYNNSQHLGELINDVLDLSKIEANKLELAITPVSIASLLADIDAMFSPSALQKGIVFDITNDLKARAGANLDYIRVKQVLVNLCSNAVKFTEQGHVNLRVSQNEKGLMFCIEDTGIGIAPDKLDAIFTNFSQGDNSITRRFGGTGLGLSLSQQLAHIMDGKISVTSTLGEGSRFCFMLPCELLELASEQFNKLVPYYASSFSGNVLLAEDHPDNRRLIERILRNLGVTVISAEHGEQAVELALAHNPDLVLMDIQMPVMDGLGALALLKECGFSNPIIALTANAMTHEIEHYKQAGFSGHLAKPIDKMQFCEVLERYLQIDYQDVELSQVDMSDLRLSFEQSLPDEIALLIEAHEHEDIEKFKRIAHRLSGAAKMFASEHLSHLIDDIERAAKFEDREHIALLLNDLKAVQSE